jgi:hypothetical protein
MREGLNMSPHLAEAAGPDPGSLILRLAQEPPGSMPGPGAVMPFHHSIVQSSQVQAEEIALLICLVMISAGVMLLTESARRHQHAAPLRAPAAHHHDHHPWRRYGLIAAVVAVLLIVGLMLFGSGLSAS